MPSKSLGHVLPASQCKPAWLRIAFTLCRAEPMCTGDDLRRHPNHGALMPWHDNACQCNLQVTA